MGILVDVTVIYGHVLTTLDVFAVQAQARLSVAQSAFRGVFPHLIDKIITSFSIKWITFLLKFNGASMPFILSVRTDCERLHI